MSIRVIRGQKLLQTRSTEFPFATSAPPDFLPRMKRKVQQLVEEAKQLPYDERAELIEQLIAAGAQDIDPKIEQAWGDEVMRRLKEIEDGKVQMIPGEEVMARARKIIGRK